MKKQLLIKKEREALPQDVKRVLVLVKNINKGAVFFTKNNIILNPVIVFGQKFLVIQITDSYKIIVRKEQWRVPSYATQNIEKIRAVMQKANKQRPGSFMVNIKDKAIEYIIPMARLIGPEDQSYYRMNFHQVFKQTGKKVSYNRYVQVNGRVIKPIFTNNNVKSYVSTSPVVQRTAYYDKQKRKFTYMISKYQIDTKTGQIKKAVQKGFQQGRRVELTAIQSRLIEQRKKGTKQ